MGSLGRATAVVAAVAWTLGSGLAPSPVAADEPTVRAEYSFDAVDAGVVQDLTGRGHTLSLTGAWSPAAGIASPAVDFNWPSLGSSPHDKDLNPVGQEFAVTAVFRLVEDTSALPDTPNLVQKGFAGDAGQWKMQLLPGPASIQCRFKGTRTYYLLTSGVTGVDDGAWHAATCWRTGGVVGVTVDGVAVQHLVDVGDITNRRALHVGGKALTAATDQFPGVLDYVAVAIGPGAELASRAGAPR